MSIRRNFSNLFGWKSKRKIVVVESDDWGSIRTSSQEAYKKMLRGGLNVDQSSFTQFDSLESNEDLTTLFEILKNHKDSTGRHPVFTPMCVVANPDFKKIREANFESYFYEPFTETCKRYSSHDRVHQLWLQGIKERLFVPQLHGREHINVKRWMTALKEGNVGLRLAFENESFGASFFNEQQLPMHLAAFNPEKSVDINDLQQILREGGKLFEDICGYTPKYFIAPNSSEPRKLNLTLKEIGVEYLANSKFPSYPLGDGRYERRMIWIGKRNSLGQIFLTRNAGFEPLSLRHEVSLEGCLDDIRNAFKWNVPAIISTHRVNFVGYLDKSNREKGLFLLDKLLKKIIKNWPDVEFITSVELGDLISSTN